MTFSVVIPTCGRDERLRRLLERIDEERNEAIIEVIVVYDGRPVPPGLPESFPTYSFLSTGRPAGHAGVRNFGALRAKGDRLIFIDDDILPTPGSLGELMQAAAEGQERSAWVGRIIPATSLPRSHYLQLAYSGLSHTPDLGEGGPLHYRHFCTSLACLPRNVFMDVGGFDEKLSPLSMEDVELGFRLRQSSVPIFFCAGAEGEHFREMDRFWFIHLCQRSGRTLKVLHKMHPQMRQELPIVPAVLQPIFLFLSLFWEGLARILPLIERLPYPLGRPLLKIIYFSGILKNYRSP